MRKKFDYPLLFSVLAISIFGLIMIYSASYVWAEYKFQDPFKFVKNQGIFFLLGVFLIFLIQKIPTSFFEKYCKKFLILCIILLICVLIPGLGTVRNGSRSWFGIGSFGIQPSEFTKLAAILFTSHYLVKHEKKMKSFRHGILPILGLILFLFFLIMLQPDFGTGMILVMSMMGLLFVGGVPFQFFLKLGVLGVIGIVGLILAAPYRLTRILSFLNPWEDPLGSGFQIIQSLYAIGPGGLFGFGFLNSRQKHFYLPEPQTDFIFSIISEEFGFLGVLIVCGFFFFIFYRMLKIALSVNDLFCKYLSFGLAFGIFIQAALNLAVVVGLIPVTGVTLPFFSYGGSSLLISMISVGLVLNVSKR